ncbi:NAD/NADP octopine/nopaline dehydrogenase family protein [Mycobacterium sp. 21AC1]|uniref:NAD/NADP octopine/nopaline dehydrogenase family protein n=1 Tax=[Mycobacterium] appelbergii TaxID=2939269 RepID=UPI0029391AE3|nr:NAD/NADP octopine/nopaline dehydrogenase family protein [Mycobacterium sp. 21AC1]MDV3127653.1 NAD/NADP octopine/nopaline dehydrogenase family protein [Mycobacterium sp. 21AC1]
MTDVYIVSDELNSYFAGLVLATRGFRVAIAGRDPAAVEVDIDGRQRTAHLTEVAEFSGDRRVGMVAAEGEDLQAGVGRVLEAGPVDLLVVVGGGTAGVVEAVEMAERRGVDPATVLVTSAFIWGGKLQDPVLLNSEKLGLLSGFLAQPHADTVALAAEVIPTAKIVDIVSVGLASLNAIVHPVPMVLAATEIERGADSRFFIDTFGNSVSEVVVALDAERVALGRQLGRELPTFVDMLDTYYANEGISGSDVRERVNTFRAYQTQVIPHSFQHRYLTHEIAGNLAPMAALGDLIGVDTPIMDALVTIGSVLSGRDLNVRATAVAAEFTRLARSSPCPRAQVAADLGPDA